MKRIRKIASALILIGTLCIGGTCMVSAKAKIQPEVLWENCEYMGGVSFSRFPGNAKIQSIKSSNTKVIVASKTGTGEYDTLLTPLKSGKSKITVTYKVGSKKESVSATYKVKKYPNPYEYIKVNGKKIDIKNYHYYYDFRKYKKGSAKIELKLKKGWSIDYAYYFKSGSDEMKDIKNGATIKMKKGAGYGVFYNLVYKDKKQKIQYGIRFNL